MGFKISPIAAHLITAVVGMIVLAIMNLWGTDNPTMTMIIGGAVGGGVWGAYQRQKEPVENSKIIESETEKGKL